MERGAAVYAALAVGAGIAVSLDIAALDRYHAGVMREISMAEGITPEIVPKLAIRPISLATRRRAAEAIGRLRALRDAILADRGGKPFTEDELTAALHEARAAHDRGE